MSPINIQQWLVPVSSAIGILGTAIAAWVGVVSYRLKTLAEARLAESAKIEREINLLRVFSDVMNIAHGRGPCQLSEKAVEFMLQHEGAADVNGILNRATIPFPVGAAAQNAAIAAVGILGTSHAVLRAPAIEALTILQTFKGEVAAKYLRDIEAVSRREAKGFR